MVGKTLKIISIGNDGKGMHMAIVLAESLAGFKKIKIENMSYFIQKI